MSSACISALAVIRMHCAHRRSRVCACARPELKKERCEEMSASMCVTRTGRSGTHNPRRTRDKGRKAHDERAAIVHAPPKKPPWTRRSTRRRDCRACAPETLSHASKTTERPNLVRIRQENKAGWTNSPAVRLKYKKHGSAQKSNVMCHSATRTDETHELVQLVALKVHIETEREQCMARESASERIRASKRRGE